jgi:hypothetical protein
LLVGLNQPLDRAAGAGEVELVSADRPTVAHAPADMAVVVRADAQDGLYTAVNPLPQQAPPPAPAVWGCGGSSASAVSLGIHQRTVERLLRAQAAGGPAPSHSRTLSDHRPDPDGHVENR